MNKYTVLKQIIKTNLNTKMVNKFRQRTTCQETFYSLLHNVQILVHFLKYCQ